MDWWSVLGDSGFVLFFEGPRARELKYDDLPER